MQQAFCWLRAKLISPDVPVCSCRRIATDAPNAELRHEGWVVRLSQAKRCIGISLIRGSLVQYARSGEISHCEPGIAASQKFCAGFAAQAVRVNLYLGQTRLWFPYRRGNISFLRLAC